MTASVPASVQTSLARTGKGEPAIEARALTKRFGTILAVDRLDLVVPGGSIFGLLGPNGAGKTTTIEILEGLLRPDEGSVRVLDIDVRREPGRLKERIGVQLQAAALYPDLTVTELVDLFASFYARRRPTNDLINELGLDERSAALTKELSGGQRQRLSIALALVNDPELIFLDEPTTGLDPQGRRSLWDHIERIRGEGQTILLTTHYMDEAEQLCDRLVVMDKARIVAEGSPRELIERYSTREVTELRFAAGVQDTLDGQLEGLAERIELLPDRVLLYADDGEAAAAAAHARGLQPETVLVRRSSLEDVFLRLTGRSLIE